jgi:ribosomal protein L35
MQLVKSIRRLITWIIWFLAFMITLEVCARLDDYWQYGASPWQAYSTENLVVQDEMGRHGKPNARYKDFVLNRFGLRMPDIEMRPEPGKVRVLLLGASELFGLYESPGQSLAEELQRMLGPNYQVINAALFGMSLPRISEYYLRYLSRFKAKVALIYPSPVFYMDHEPPGPASFEPAIARPGAKRFQLRITGKIKDAGKRHLPHWLQTRVRRLLIRRGLAKRPADYVWHKVPPDRIERFGHDLKELVGILHADGLKVVVATHPSRFLAKPDPDADFWGLAWRQNYPRATVAVIRDTEKLGNQQIREIAKTLGFGVADLAAEKGWTHDMFADFCHFTDQGAAKAARGLARAIGGID